MFMTGVSFLIFYFPLTYILNSNDNRLFFLMDLDYPKMLFEFFIQCLYDYTHIKVLQDLSAMLYLTFYLSFTIILAYFPNSFTYSIIWGIIMIFVITGFLLYTQCLIINACNLSYYVEENIIKRGENEFMGELKESTLKKNLYTEDTADDEE